MVGVGLPLATQARVRGLPTSASMAGGEACVNVGGAIKRKKLQFAIAYLHFHA